MVGELRRYGGNHLMGCQSAVESRTQAPSRQLQREAAAAGGAKLDWPAPAQACEAVDEVEHDLATLRALIEISDRQSVRGQAHYLLGLNDALRRSVTRRWVRARSRWLPQDGLVRVAPATQAMLQAQRLSARPYSVSALQKFTTCPYQFVLINGYAGTSAFGGDVSIDSVAVNRIN